MTQPPQLPPPPSMPPGWYDDPQQPAWRRYWDGTEWTDKVSMQKPNENLFIAGVVTALVFPIAGIVLGIILIAKDDNRGLWVLLGSGLVLALALAALA